MSQLNRGRGWVSLCPAAAPTATVRYAGLIYDAASSRPSRVVGQLTFSARPALGRALLVHNVTRVSHELDIRATGTDSRTVSSPSWTGRLVEPRFSCSVRRDDQSDSARLIYFTRVLPDGGVRLHSAGCDTIRGRVQWF